VEQLLPLGISLAPSELSFLYCVILSPMQAGKCSRITWGRVGKKGISIVASSISPFMVVHLLI